MMTKNKSLRLVGNHRIERVRDREYPRPQRNLFALQTARIAGSIEEFLVRENNFRGIPQERDANQHVGANLAMFAHRRALPLSRAREEIRRCSGAQFDPKVVEVFFSLPESLWVELRKNLGAPFRLLAMKTTPRIH